jgi:hypothetical protein
MGTISGTRSVPTDPDQDDPAWDFFDPQGDWVRWLEDFIVGNGNLTPTSVTWELTPVQ